MATNGWHGICNIVPMKPNDQMQLILDELEKLNPLPIENLSPEQARLMPLPDRAAMAAYGHHITKKAFAPFPLPVGQVEHQLIPGPAGDILIRIYSPVADAPDDGYPVLVYFHGGGWVVANLDTYDSSCRALCEATSAVVVSVHYRQAPEAPYPAAVEDAVAAYTYISTNPAEFGGAPGKIAIAGESAGGNLAAVVCLIARDQGLVQPLHQLLIYPVTDVLRGSNSPSAIENSKAKPLNKAMLDWFYDLYAPSGIDRANPHLSPLYAYTHENLPPATILLAEIDPLRSDGEAYAAKLNGGHVHVRLETYTGVTHEFFGMVGLVNESTAAVKVAAEELKKAFR